MPYNENPLQKEKQMSLDAYHTPEDLATIKAAEDLIASLEALRDVLTK
jgi:hypothetical protein